MDSPPIGELSTFLIIFSFFPPVFHLTSDSNIITFSGSNSAIRFMMYCATESFSAITNFIFFHSNFVSFFHFLLLFDSINSIMYIE